jgi:nitrite reductase/ring-hydroxylating ferredoxin subunit
MNLPEKGTERVPIGRFRMVDNGLSPAAGEVLLVTRDSLVTSRLRAACVSRGLRVVESEPELSSPPRLVAVDLADPAALRSVPEWRRAWPDALLAGHLALPDRAAWLAAEQAGFDLVVNQGAFVGAVLRRLDSPAVPTRRRYPLIASSDAAGRLGCVLRLADSPVGPLALYHISKQFYAIADRCPHAGARLSHGELVGAVLTCPEHGSQFDVQTGERLRGPADESPRRFPLVEEGGQVYLLVEGDALHGGER